MWIKTFVPENERDLMLNLVYATDILIVTVMNHPNDISTQMTRNAIGQLEGLNLADERS